MKTFAISLFLTMLSFSVHSQRNDTILIHNDFKIRLGLKISHEWCIDISRAKQEHQLFSGGFQFLNRIKKTRSSIESGLYVNPTATTYVKYYQFVDNVGNTYRQHFNFDIEYYYLTIPFNYRIDTKSIFLSGGLFINNLLFRYGEYLTYKDSIENYGTDRKFNWGWNIAIGMEKHITDKINMFVEAKYVYTISSFKTDGNFVLNGNSLAASFNNYGFTLGVNYKIRKLRFKPISG